MSRESERIWGSPVELYLFSIGTVQYRYCDADRAVTDPVSGLTYNPLTLDRGRVSSAANLDKTQMKVVVPLDCEIAEQFRGFPPGFTVGLRIFAGHLGPNGTDPIEPFSLVWTGRVLQGARDRVSGGSEQCILTCEPASTTMRRNGLRRNWQLTCPHALYGPECGVLEATSQQTATIDTLGSSWIDLMPGWEGPFDPVKFRAGKVSWPSEFGGLEQRMILQVETNTLRLAGPTVGLEPGDAVQVNLGCNRTMSDCRDLHNNILNFGGQPWIPVENPIGKSQL